MSNKKNYSVIVASGFFVLFLVFVLAFNNSITGYAVASGVSEIYKFEQLGMVKFDIKNNEMVIKDISEEFKTKDYIWCLVYFDNNTLKSKDDKLDIYFYSPNGLNKQFLDVTNNIANASKNEVGGLCDSSNLSVCGAFYQVNESLRGNWNCTAVTTTSAGQFNASSGDKRFVMINAPPVLDEDIPDINISKDGTYSEIDADEYFSDPEDDKLEYGVSGLNYLTAKFSSSNKLTFSNPNKFEGVENITIRVSDGYNSASSNYFLVKVGNGSNVPVTKSCIPDWKATSWSACISNLQVRTVIDANSCGSDIGKPSETQSCTELPSDMTSGQKYTTVVSPVAKVESSVSPMIFILLGLGLISLVGVGIYYLANKLRTKPEQAITNDIKTEAKPEVNQEVKFSNAVNNDLDSYIQKSIEAGVNVESIKQNLLSVGWDVKNVNERIAFVQAKVYIKSKLDQGVDKEKLKQSFLLKGWNEEQLRKLFD